MATTMGDDPTTQHPSGTGGSGAPDDAGTGGASAAASTSPVGPGGNRFFSWLRGLGILRTQGWIGGVAAGVAARLGIDPLVVRGILVVVAVLGGPVVLIYAAAWLLLPDEHDVIHAEELGRGRFSPAIAGIGALVLLSLLPLTQGFWYAGALYWGAPHVDISLGRLLWTAVLITAIVFFVIWVARRSGAGASATGTGTAPAAPAAPTPTVDGVSAADAAAPASAPASAPPAAFASEPPKPGTEASADELAAWRRQQDEWKQQRAAWAAEQKRTDRELAAQVAREKARQNAEAAIERARIRRITRPRTSGAYVFIALGAAILAGAIAVLLWPSADGGYDATVGWAAATFVLGGSIVLAGALRRRSGFLTFASFVVLIAMLVSSGVPADRQLILPGSHHGVSTMMSGQYAQPAGSIELTVWDDNSDEVQTIDLWQGRGSVSVFVEEGQTVRVEANTDGRDVRLFEWAEGSGTEETTVTHHNADDGRFSSTTVAGAPGEPDVVITLWQGQGTVMITELPA